MCPRRRPELGDFQQRLLVFLFRAAALPPTFALCGICAASSFSPLPADVAASTVAATALPVSFACLRIFRMRLKAAAMDSKSPEGRTSLHRLRPRHASTTSSGLRRQNGIHHVIVKAQGVAQIELQPLAEEMPQRSGVVDIGGKFLLRGGAAIGFARIGEQLVQA